MAATTNVQCYPTSTHWGSYLIETSAGKVSAVLPHEQDTNPSPIGQSLLSAHDLDCRIAQPMIRKGYLEKRWQSSGAGRGVEPFVAVSWDQALAIAAEELARIKENFGNESIYGGSYGWGSAGRFHHSQSQLHRFLNGFGGYTYSIQSYSTGTAQIILPHVLGVAALRLMMEAPTVEDMIKHTKLVVSFGGISMKNMQINQGGIGDHSSRDQLQAAKDAGVKFINVSPVRDDVADFLDAEWLACRPNSDVALMLGLAHTLLVEDLHDKAFLKRYCVGFDRFANYVLGAEDGQAKDADWAAGICDIDAETIRTLARRMAKEPCLLSISWSLQRTEHGDQPYWLITTLGAMLGRIGLPGQGIGYGYGCIHNFGFAGRKKVPFNVGELSQGENPVENYIPVARIADMLFNPGGRYDFNGEKRTYPDIRLVYWTGGNPYHHHQDLNRLRRAWAQPETVIVHDCVWTATARHADIVFPATTALERNDFASGRAERYFTPMHQVLPPYADSRDDYSTFSELANRLGFAEQFTEGRNAMQWVEYLWQVTRQRAAEHDIELPDFDTFWHGGQFAIPQEVLPDAEFTLEKFRADPNNNSLGTPSGRIEIFSERIASFDYPDNMGHAAWLEKEEFIGSPRSKTYPLALISNQPKTRLHSQYDHGVTSREAKIKGREPARLHPADAAARGIKDGDIIRLFNDRGACLAGAIVSDRVRAGAIELATGAWYDPQDPAEEKSLEVHGNPNVLTRDKPTSTLAQGTSAHSCLVQVERYDEPLPEIKAFRPPPIERAT